MQPVDTFEAHGLTVNLYPDEDPTDPRDGDNLGTMVCWHPRYSLGDPHQYRDPQEFLEELPPGSIILPLYLYDHSGLAMSTGRDYPFNCPWDSGQVGYIYTTPETIRREFSRQRISAKLRQQVTGYLQNEVEEYHKYISGQCYYYTITDPAGTFVDSCGGFLGYDFCRQQAEEQAQWFAEHPEEVTS